jgi:hypothetical protein
MMGKIRDILRDYLDNETMARLKKTLRKPMKERSAIQISAD